MAMSTIDEAVAAIASGRPVVVLDDEDRENEADLIMAAEHATPADVAFFLEHTSGFLCVALSPERAEKLHLDPMTADNSEA
ncbi:3,4-dihydroxy-2-butanone-4-phosphate synthase, partial [Mycobacterium sp.]|uniref:3,4-dihydroxy-2-butanone-4-phosphate synthase n=1 Tax=Mycobacterium sp. TaxID=1785 RepID=UPI002D860E30|nr:3,4-dihydroxy-2-butanone-4-phosphate synthase [Mycobacterium sp.]